MRPVKDEDLNEVIFEADSPLYFYAFVQKLTDLSHLNVFLIKRGDLDACF